jgi:hypothetical protein
MKPDRRALEFVHLSEVMGEVDRLLPGHKTLGNWTLGQICHHLASAMIYSVDGFPSLAPWPLRKTVGKLVGRRLFRTGRMPDGIKLPAEFGPQPGLDDRAEAEALRAAIRCFESHPGPFGSHPLIGPLDRESWTRFHTIHAAHHLGFVIPETGAGT